MKLDAMSLALGIKLLQHPGKFGNALRETRGLHIVELSYRDPW